MRPVYLRSEFGKSSPDDLVVNVQDSTYDYLMSSGAFSIRVSTFLDQDWPNVQAKYAELYLSDDCPFESRISDVIPGSRVRKGLALPGEMKEGEQLTVVVARKAKSGVGEQ
jgi:hypothetical protein